MRTPCANQEPKVPPDQRGTKDKGSEPASTERETQLCCARLVCADASKEDVVPKGSSTGQRCAGDRQAREKGWEEDFRDSSTAGFLSPADTISCRIRTGHPQHAPSLADDTEMICSKCYSHTECTELAS